MCKLQRGIADSGEGLGDHSYPSSDPQPCSRGEVQGRKARVLLKLDPARPAGRKAGGREGLSGSWISLRQGEAGCSSYI